MPTIPLWLALASMAAAIVAACIAIDRAARLAAARRALSLRVASAREEAGHGPSESEAWFHSAFNFAAIGMALVSPEGHWLQVNRAICQIVGYSERELLVCTFQDITHPEDLSADLSFVRQMLSGEIDTYQMEKRYLHKQGHVVWVLLSVSLVRAEDGTPLHFISQIQDISARKAAEQAVRESEERFQLVATGTHDGIWDWNMASGHCYYSPRYKALLGYGDAEVEPTRAAFEAWLHPEDRQRVAAALQAHFAQRAPYSVEYRLRTRSGSYSWFHARGQASWDAHGAPVRFTGSLRDITDAMEAAERLRRSTELLRQTGRLGKIGGWERDLSTNVPVWTEEVRAIVGVEADFQPTVENAHQFYAPEALPILQRAVHETIETGKSFELELPYITAQQRRIWVRVQGEAELREGKPVRIFGTLQDITERKQAELALERSQKFLDAVIEAIPQPLFVKDRQHRWVLFNQHFCDLLGQSREALLGQSDPDLFPPDTVERFWAEDDEAFGMDQPLFVETQVAAAGGSPRWLLKSKRRVDLADGSYLVGIGTDITRLKQIQDALASSEESHRLLAEHSSDVISRITPEGVLTYVSAASVGVLGYEPDALLHRSIQEFIHPDDLPEAARLYTEVVRSNVVNVVTCRLRRCDDTWTWVETSFRAMRPPGGAWTVQVIGVSRNVDERVRAGEALNRFKQVLDNTIDMIFMFDSESLRYSYVNRGAVDTLGYARERLLEMTPWQLRGNLSEQEYRKSIEPFLKGEIQSRHFETVHRCADGSEIPVDVTMQFMRQPGEAHGLFISVTRNAAERKKIERMKNEFVSTVSHELRTPLTSIRGSLGLIAGGAIGEVGEQARRLVAIAYNNSERLVRLINDILDMEKIESGKMSFQLQPHRIRPLLEQAIEANRAYGEQLGVRFQIEGAVPDAIVPLDSDRFMQVMANLLSNAAKFSPAGGTVHIETQHREGAFRILVKDQGPGIPEEFRSKIFGKFSQADASDSRQKGGTGLGLSIVRAIMDRHEGDVGFETQLGRGTTFHVTFPSARRAVIAEDAAESFLPQRVLVCEDEPEVAFSIAASMRRGGFAPDIAHTLEQARKLLSVERYCAMTLDLILPDGDGVDLIREVRMSAATRDLPIVVVSADTEDGQLRLNGGVTPLVGWLDKPLDPNTLMQVVRDKMRAPLGCKPRILHVEDDADVRQVVASIAAGIAEFDAAAGLLEAVRKIHEQQYALVILDLELPDGSGWDLLSALNELETPPPVVVFSAHQVDSRSAKTVAGALIKSSTSNEALLAVIERVARPIRHTDA
jgi:PAS domain S-box-containing protein